jgi:hypothetical protein
MSFNDQVTESLRAKMKVLDVQKDNPPESCGGKHCFCQYKFYRDLAGDATAVGNAAHIMLPELEAREFTEWADAFNTACQELAEPVLAEVVKAAVGDGTLQLVPFTIPLPEAGEA